MKVLGSLQLDFRSVLLYLFIVLTILFDNTVNTIYATISFIILFIFNLSNISILKYRQLHYNLFFPLWCFLSLLWTSNPSGGFTRAMSCLILFTILVVIMSYTKRRDSTFVDSLLFFYVVGTLALAATTFRSLQNVGLMEMLASVERMDTDVLNLNMLGKYFAIGTVICIHYIISKKNLLFYIPFFIFNFLILLTKSRSSLLSVLLGCFFYLYFYFKGINNMKAFWRVFLATIVCLFFLAKMSIWGDAFIRFEGMFDFFSSHGKYGEYSMEMRDLYLRKGLESIPESPIWGHGIGSVVDVMRRLVNSSMTVEDAYFHNNYVQLLSEVGIIGFLLFYIPIFSIVKTLFSLKGDNKAVVLLAIILLFLFNDTNNTTYYHKIYYIFLGISFFYIETKRKEIKNSSLCINNDTK